MSRPDHHQAENGNGCSPATFRVVPKEGRPASVLVLRILDGVQRWFDVSGLIVSERQSRQTGRLNSLLADVSALSSTVGLYGLK